MTRINNYSELVTERVRLQEALRNQKAVLKTELNSIKATLEPVGDVLSLFGMFKRKDSGTSSLLKTGVAIGIDLLVRDKLLSKASWVTRAVLPVVLKGISNLFIKKKTTPAKIEVEVEE